MTDDTVKAEARSAKGASMLASLVTDLAFTAGLAWVAGIALNVGFGVPVPFVATWLLALVGLWGSQVVVAPLAQVWHTQRVKADINLLAASMAAQDAIQGEQVAGLRSFLAKVGEDDAKNNGAYL